MFLGLNLIIWIAKKQHTVSRRNAESENGALAAVVAEIRWLRSLLQDLHISPCRPIEAVCDNISAMHLAVNPIQHALTKLIADDLHFVQEHFTRGDIAVRFHFNMCIILRGEKKIASTRCILEIKPRVPWKPINQSSLEANQSVVAL